VYEPIEPPEGEMYRFRFCRYCYYLIELKLFQTIIMLSIIINTVILSLDRYPEPPESQMQFFNQLNIVFTVIFTVEVVLKLGGLGAKKFSKDKFNIFDTIVVAISLVELSLANGTGGAVSALRAFRLFRIFKLARSWESLKLLMDSIAHTISAIGNFTILLTLFIYVYSLLGMQFYANKLAFDKNGNKDRVNGEVPRAHFDSLLWAFVTIFQVLVGDNWNEVMYESMRAVGWYSCIYFISLVIFGNIIMLNLFLAILLGNFDEASYLMKEIKFVEEQRKKMKKASSNLAAASAFAPGQVQPEFEESQG